MARDMSDKEILKMELDQLNPEITHPYVLPNLYDLLSPGNIMLKNTETVYFPLTSTVSTTAPEIIAFVEGLSAEDPLVKGVPEDKNPFKEKGGCIIT
ncbi:guanine nucleotide-binding protein G(I)/G(S)/G(O) subunit gamma-T2 [Cyprinus carpio]|uniref:Guanine nucleotide-binding protein G(I)/G(S)/G(O) subunit gamma-T2 n=1 Tax=Cyprinus carpio TaxID=7962 RepID=A0A9R0ABI1_CYPCA|nr:guanine nucleotide-binding protein G(I)/G(S)/G(O) subunit gamma-T2 [Cyprinus carpio]